MDNTLHIPSEYFNKSGFFNPRKTSKINLILICSDIIIYSLLILILSSQFLFFQKNVDDFVDNVEGVGAFSQIMGKIFVLLYYRKSILKLIDLRKYFLKSHECSSEIQTEIKNISTNVILFQKTMIIAFTIVLYTTLLMMVFSGKTLPCGSWQIPDQETFYIILLCFIMVTIVFLPKVVANFDNLYLGFCFEMIKQFKILCYHTQNLNIEVVQSQNDFTLHYIKLKKIIQHHQFLIRYIDEVKNIFSVSLLVEYGTIIPIIICELYAISISTNYTASIRYVVMGSASSVQMALYCLSADFLAQEALKVSTAIYSSNWYSKHFKIFRIPTVMLLRASQKEIELTACGLIAFNARTLVHVFRVVLSANAFLRSMEDITAKPMV